MRVGTGIAGRARIGIATCVSAIALCVLGSPGTAIAAPEHAYLSGSSLVNQFSAANGVATDPQGNLYVSNAPFFGGVGGIKVYSPGGAAFITEFLASANASPSEPKGVAVDANGNVYVKGTSGEVVKYKPSSFPPTGATTYSADTAVNGTGQLIGSKATAVAVDPSNQNVYVAQFGTNEKQTYSRPTSATCGAVPSATEYTLTFREATTTGLNCSATSTNTNPSAAAIEAALNALPTISGVGASVTVTGSGTKTIEFKGSLRNTDIESEAIIVKKITSEGEVQMAKSNTSTTGAPSRVSRFQPDGTLVLGTIGSAVAAAEFYGVDVYGANGNVYLTDSGNGKAYVLNPAGSSVLAQTAGPPGGFGSLAEASLAVDQASGRFLVSDVVGHASVVEFNAAAKLVTSIAGPPALANALPSDIVVDNSVAAEQGRVYVTSGLGDGQSSVYAFGALSPQFALTAGTVGSGTGTIACDLGAGFEACLPKYAEGEEVTLVATPGGGSKFVKWIGGTGSAATCNGSTSSSCTFNLNAASSINAEFGPTGSKLTVSKSGPGTATISSQPSGISCGSECEKLYTVGEVVKLTAAVDPGSALKEWTGCDAIVETDKCQVTLSTDKAVTAVLGAKPSVVTGAATGTTKSSTTLNGTVDPNEFSVTDCKFEYGTAAPAYGQTAACVPSPGAGDSPVAVSAEVTGLTSGQTYHFRLVAGNSAGSSQGSDETVAVPSVTPPTVTTTAGATTITQTSAKVAGTVNPNGIAVTSCEVEYGTSLPSAGKAACVPTPGSGSSPEAVTVDLSGLSPNTTYKFRFVAKNGEPATGQGSEEEFTTLTNAPAVTNSNPGTVTQTSIVLKGTVDNNGAAGGSACKFQIALESSPGTPIAEPACSTTPVTGSGSTAVEATVSSGLAANTKYVYRVLATNSGGTSTGTPDKAVQTLPNAPTVTTAAGATSISQTSATVAGTVNPNGGNVTSCKVKYGTTTSYGSEVDCASLPGSGTSAAAVSKGLTGLTANTTYHFKFVATNAGGSGEGGDQEFKTAPNAPTVTNDPEGALTSTTAVLKGHVNANGADAGCDFQVAAASDPSFSGPVKSVDCTPDPVVGGSGNAAVTATATGLSPNTAYIYRVVATNTGGTTNGTPAEAFATLPNAPTVTTTAGATSISQTGATVAGTVNPNGGNVTSCKVKYGTTTSYGSEVDCASLPGSGTSAAAVSKGLTGLTANTTYHFKFVATNAGGSGEGGDQEFKTAPNFPTVTTTAGATEISQTAAKVAGSVDPNFGEVTSCKVEYGTGIGYGQSAPCSPASIGSGNSPVAVSASLAGLSANTTYHFRVVATNAGGTGNGPDRTFTTLANTCATDSSLCPPSGGGGTGGGGGGSAPPPSNQATPGAAQAKGENVVLTVSVPGPGKLQATGKNLVTAKGTAQAGGKVKLKLKLTAAGKKALKKKGKLKVKVKIVFTPNGGSPGTSTKTVTFKAKGK